MQPQTIRETCCLGAAVGAALVLAGVAAAQGTWRASVDSSGVQGTSASYGTSLSFDGRFVTLYSASSNLIAGDLNGRNDTFVHDRRTGAIERISVGNAGTEGNGDSFYGRISDDGRWVAFVSTSDNFAASDTNFSPDVFVRDRQAGTTERVSVDSSGTGANNASGNTSSGLAISADGRFVAFTSFASNLVAGDTNNAEDIFVRDRQNGTTERVSVDSSGIQGNGSCIEPSLSADGRYVAFISIANNLVTGDTNGWFDAFVHDRSTGTTVCVSVDATGVPGAVGAQPEQTAISADGRYVVFTSLSSNLVAGDTNGNADVFVRDVLLGVTERVDVDSSGAQTTGQPSGGAAISAGGRFVLFYSRAANLVANDTNHATDAFVHDRVTAATTRVSVDSSGAQQDSSSSDSGYPLAMSADGRFTAFSSFATNLVAGDTNACDDVFVHGAYLTLEASASVVTTGSALSFDVWDGQPSGTTVLAAIDINSTPLFTVLFVGSFDASGRWSVGGTVPAGLGGNDVTFQEFGFTPTGKVRASNAASVSFQ